MKSRRFKKWVKVVVAVTFAVNMAYVITLVPVVVAVLNMAPIEWHY